MSLDQDEVFGLAAIVVLLLLLLVVRTCVPVHPLEKPRPSTPPESFYK